MSSCKSTRLFLAFALLLAVTAHARTAPELQATEKIDSTSIRPGLVAFAVTPETENLPENKKETLARLAAPAAAPLVKGDPAQFPAPIQVAIAPTADEGETFLPQSKQETIATLSVPEIAPLVKRHVLPQYPVFAHQARIQGMVYARVLIDASGKVVQVAKIEGQSIFHRAVEAAVRQWEFIPARQGSLAVRSWVTLPFSFEM